MMSEAKLQGEMKAGSGSSEEPMTTQELLQRLRELETENSALAQANENQRETYERCLDEVANHVVQALLNQKDLREECIKLKKRVFDLERQNQALSDLFHQRLTSGPLSQFPVHPASLLPDPFSNSQTGAVEKFPTTFPLGRCITQREVLSEETCVGIPRPNPQALEALSPFLRKKAQILEVLRSLEEMDPLLAFPSPWRDPGQAATTEGVTAEAWPCLLLAQGESVAGPPPLKREGSSSSSSDEAGYPEPPEKGHPGQVLLSALAERKIDLGDVETYLQQVLREAGDPALLNGEPNGPCVLEGSEGPVSGYKHIQAVSCLEGLGPPSASREPVYLGVLAPGEVKDRPRQGPPIPSPSKVLKLLKMPPPPPSPAALSLSPQLTRSSKIPCRSNTYEVYHSLTPNHKGSPDSPFPHEASIVGGHPSPKAGRHLIPGPTKVTPTSPEPFGYRRPHDYENILELSLSGAMDSHPRDGKQGGPEGLSPACRSAPLPAVPASHACLEPYPFAAGPEKPGPESRHSPPLARRNPEGSKKVLNGPSKRTNMPEVVNMSFKERLTVLGKLKGTEGKESAGFEKGKAPAQPCERVEGLVETHPRLVTGSSSLKHHEPCHSAEPSPRGYASHSVGSRGSDAEHHVSRSRPLGTPAARHPAKVPPPGKNAKSPHGSPTKLPSKSPTKPPAQEPRPCPPPTKASQTSMGRKNPPCSDPARGKAGGPATIEEKVMKGIEENVLRRHKGAPAAGEVKQKNSSGLASWFGLRKSKLPALNRRPEAPKAKEGKLGSRRLEAESLNISKLMEKAEDLRKALEEEKAYINGLALDKPRPHGCNPGHSQLTLMYQEVTAENFMQQLLNRVDGKEVPFETHLEQKNELQRGLGDAKDPHLVRPPRNGIVGHLHACPEAPAKLRDAALQEQVPPEDNLAEAVGSQHFAVCGSLTRTLDSGIGTFPPPDYCSGMPCKSVPKLRPRLDPPPAGFSPARGPPPVTRMPRKARTLEREVPSGEDLLGPSKHQSMPAFHGVLTSAAPALGHHDRRGCPEDPCSEPSKPRHTQQSKNWTFPNAKVSIGTDPFFCSPHRLEGLHGSAMGSACSVVERRRASSEGPQASPAFSTSSSRTPSASDVGEEVSTKARSRDMGPEGQPGLENSESLSDSLYDSLSSCGSQG